MLHCSTCCKAAQDNGQWERDPGAFQFCNSPGISQEIMDITNSKAKMVKEIPEIRKSEFLLLALASWTNPLNISTYLSSVRAGFYKSGHKSVNMISQEPRKPMTASKAVHPSPRRVSGTPHLRTCLSKSSPSEDTGTLSSLPVSLSAHTKLIEKLY